MSNVTLAIGGRNFTVACDEGEESHVEGLGRLISEKLATLGDLRSQSESRMLLFATLLLADELHEARAKADAVPVAPEPQPTAPALPEGFGERLDAIAAQLENLASRLEDDDTSA